MSRRLPLVLCLAVVAAVPAAAVVVPGGGPRRSDCYVGFEVEGPDVQASSSTTVKEAACNGSCSFRVRMCVDEPMPGCAPAIVRRIRVFRSPGVRRPRRPRLPRARYACGRPVTYALVLRDGGSKASAITLRTRAVTAGGEARIDRDRLVLRCLPPPPAQALECPPNPQGGPDELSFAMLGTGTDLDLGWTGMSHNLAWPKDPSFRFCLAGCDTGSNSLCTAAGPTGLGSANGATFGPPLPVVAGGVAVCIVSRYQQQSPAGIAGTVHLDTGEVQTNVDLFSDVYVTDATKVCPRCETGTCDSGTNRGKACAVDGEVTVVNSLAANKTFKLSKDCPPLGTAIATFNIPLRLTTGTVGTPGTGGSKPCGESNAAGVTVQDDNCGSAGCGAPCQPGSDACKTMEPDPGNPDGPPVCVDVKGGISQVCCVDDPALPCFPTRPGGAGIVRGGRAVVPQPPWPDPTYPKSAEGEVVVSTFCAPSSNNSFADTVGPSPVPGAVILNTRMNLMKISSCSP